MKASTLNVQVHRLPKPQSSQPVDLLVIVWIRVIFHISSTIISCGVTRRQRNCVRYGRKEVELICRIYTIRFNALSHDYTLTMPWGSHLNAYHGEQHICTDWEWFGQVNSKLTPLRILGIDEIIPTIKGNCRNSLSKLIQNDFAGT